MEWACEQWPVRLPLLTAKDYTAPSQFEPANLLREARRQKGLPDMVVPAVGLLDPDGDIVRSEHFSLLKNSGAWLPSCRSQHGLPSMGFGSTLGRPRARSLTWCSGM